MRALPLCACCRHYPGAATGRPACSFTQPYQPSPTWLSGRPAHRPFRGLLGVHTCYGLHTRAVTVFRDTLHRRLQPLRYLHDCSGCFRLERLPGGAFTHWKSAAFSRRTPIRDTRICGLHRQQSTLISLAIGCRCHALRRPFLLGRRSKSRRALESRLCIAPRNACPAQQ